jgi:hypothetical protein
MAPAAKTSEQEASVGQFTDPEDNLIGVAGTTSRRRQPSRRLNPPPAHSWL